MEWLATIRDNLPAIMLASGIALIVTPRWVRWAIAAVLILFGMIGLWPGLLEPRAAV